VKRELTRGQLVYSLAGNDKGEAYLVWDIIDNTFVRVVNGRKRSVANPKKKNIKHLQPVKRCAGVFARKKLSHISDLEVRQAIDRLTGIDSNQQGGKYS